MTVQLKILNFSHFDNAENGGNRPLVILPPGKSNWGGSGVVVERPGWKDLGGNISKINYRGAGGRGVITDRRVLTEINCIKSTRIIALKVLA